MKLLVVLCMSLASCMAKPSIGYSYSAPAVSYSSSYIKYPQPLLQTYASSPLLYSSPLIQKLAPISYSEVHHQPLLHSAGPVFHSAVPVTTVLEGVKTQYHTQDILGQASYGHSEPAQSHNAVQDAHGNKIGSFSYVKPDGQIHRTDYVADAAGYRVASNDLPIGPGAAPAVSHEAAEIIAAKSLQLPLHHPIYKRSIYSYAQPAPVVVTPIGHLADTPEVAAAKAAHFAEHAKRGNYNYGYPSQAAVYSHSPVVLPHNGHVPTSYHGPWASPVVTPSGYLADTPEVAVAKAAHFAEKAKVSAQSHHYNSIPVQSIQASYYEPHYPIITPDGHVAETPEVAAAKAAHLAEHAAASARASHDDNDDGEYHPQYEHNSIPHSTPYQYSPYASYLQAAPVITPSGHIADTPEVAHAKAAHLAEYAAVASRQKRSILLGHTPASTTPLHAPYVYNSAIATHPVVYSTLYHPIAKPVTHTAIVHGPHAVSYSVL